VNYGFTGKKFGYIQVRRCKEDAIDQIDKALAVVGDAPGLVLDFRGNSGGGMDHEAFMGRFVPQGKTLSFAGKYGSAGPKPYGGPIVVIVDGTVRSTGETASGIFKEDGRAYMIGESPTAGMSSSKTTLELPSGLFGLYVSVSSNKGRFQNGEGIEGIGVRPHELIAFDPKDLADGVDTLIKVAEERLERFPQEKVPYRPGDFGWAR
jgi:C-terminal processing protease CtpA/Prc